MCVDLCIPLFDLNPFPIPFLPFTPDLTLIYFGLFFIGGEADLGDLDAGE